MASHRLRRPVAWAAATLLAITGSLVAATPGHAHGGGVEYLYAAGDPYLAGRVQEVTDTSDVLLAMEWSASVAGTVNGARICLDISSVQIGPRLPLYAVLWRADGTLLAVGSASEGITGAAPCFYDIGFGTAVPITANQRYVIGFWVRGGQYSYVPDGFADNVTNAGHLTGWSNQESTVGSGNGLYAYTSAFGSGAPFPVDSWQNSDYLVSPRFTPGPH